MVIFTSMDLDLDKKIALVTGSTAGIGFSIARQLAHEGATVYVNGRTQARVDDAIRRIGGGDVKGVLGDLSTRAGSDALIAQIPRLDVLINNFATVEVKPVLEISDDGWMHAFETNVLSGIRLARAYMPGMVARKWGRIVFISSDAALQIPAEMVSYGMTKTAQIAVARGLAESFPASGVTVNSVLPGPTDSEGFNAFIDSVAKQSGVSRQEVVDGFFAKARPSSLLKRVATTDEVASMVTYLCSEAAAATTGSAIRVDGGMVQAIA